MIDLRLLRDEPDRVRASQRVRGESEGLVDLLLAADDARRAALTRFEQLRAEQKALGREVGRAKGDARTALLHRAQELAAQVKAAEAEHVQARELLAERHAAVPNIVEEGTPTGGEDDYVVLEHVGTPRDFDADGFTPRDHVELGELLGAIDVERGAKVSGSRFYYLTGPGALLEMALVNHAIAMAVRHGFTPVIPPALVRPAAMEGTGFLGQAAENVYRLDADDLYLVGTSEVPLAAYHMGEILDPDELPLRYAGYSPCYRREAGAHGRDTRGIIRVHWFDKVEMFVFTTLDQAAEEHRRLLAYEREFLDSLGLAYRVIDTAGGDLGLSAARKFDCEVWIPTQGAYREVTSTSNCTDFQSRRLDIRVRARDEQGRAAGTEPVATLNGTLVAVPRMIVAILENFQQPDGSVIVPEPLRAMVGTDVITPRARRGRAASPARS